MSQGAHLFGDATGNGLYGALDASFIARVAVGLDSGFDAYDRVDPILIGDVTGNGMISAFDASFVARKAVGLPQPEIPDLPVAQSQLVVSDSIVGKVDQTAATAPWE